MRYILKRSKQSEIYVSMSKSTPANWSLPFPTLCRSQQTSIGFRGLPCGVGDLRDAIFHTLLTHAHALRLSPRMRRARSIHNPHCAVGRRSCGTAPACTSTRETAAQKLKLGLSCDLDRAALSCESRRRSSHTIRPGLALVTAANAGCHAERSRLS